VKEGYWLNARTGVYHQVREHAYSIVDREFAVSMGLSAVRWRRIHRLDPQRDRVSILLEAMRGGLIRVRGHGISITCEFTISERRAQPAIATFLHLINACGPATQIVMQRLTYPHPEQVRPND